MLVRNRISIKQVRQVLPPSSRLLHASSAPAARLMGFNSITEGPQQLPPAPPSIPVASRPPAPSITLKKNGVPKQDLGAIVALDMFLLRALTQLQASFGGSYADLPSLMKQMNNKDGRALDEPLLSESAPSEARKLKVGMEDSGPIMTLGEGEQDGLVTVAHVVGGVEPTVTVCSGFCVGERAEGEGAKILTCSHTLTSMLPHLPSRSQSSQPHTSATFVLTSSGHVFPVTSLLSSLPSSDLLILSIAPEPIRDPSYSLKHAGQRSATGGEKDKDRTVPRLKSLPVSMYPAVAGTRIASLVYQPPMSKKASDKREFAYGRVIEYKDAIGRTAETGTYDDLASMSISNIPLAGASGGPVIDIETGAVVGIIRGSLSSYGDKGSRGFATPSEKVFELFQIAGFAPKSARKDAAEQDSAADVGEGGNKE